MNEITCPKCQTANTPDSKFCRRCGRTLSQTTLKLPPEPGSGNPLKEAALMAWRSSPARHIAHRIGKNLQELASGLSALISAAASQYDPGRDNRHVTVPPPLAEQYGKTIRLTAPTGTPCPRCGFINQREGAHCARCGSLMHAPPAAALNWTFGRKSELGKRTNNEDAANVYQVNANGDEPVWLAILADGMGGGAAGEKASALALEEVRAQVAGGLKDAQSNHARLLQAAIVAANTRIYQTAAGDSTLQGMGTTVAAALIKGATVTCANVGDSRIYQLDSQGQLNQISTDHSLVNMLVTIGQISAEEALTHPQRNMLYRSVGVEPKVEVDSAARQLVAGDRLILCSDGLINPVRDADIAAIAMRAGSPQAACEALCQAALGGGGEDNVTVIVLAAA